jgi:hypothetical protein
MVEDVGLKIIASRSHSMASSAYQISLKSTTQLKVIGEGGHTDSFDKLTLIFGKHTKI